MSGVSRVCSSVRESIRLAASVLCVLGFGTVQLAWMVGWGFLLRFRHGASGKHHECEGNADRSTHMHPALSPCCCASTAAGTTVACHADGNWMA
jgi:hypothetical protein